MSEPEVRQRAIDRGARSDGGSSAPAVDAPSDAFASLVDDLHAHVLPQWASYYPARAGAATPQLRFETREFGYSVLLMGTFTFSEDGPERFVIKLRRKQKDGSILPEDVTDRTRALSRTEYDEHVRAYAFFTGRSGELSVVRPLDFVDRYHALVVDHARGKDLSRVVRDGDAIALLGVQRCGQWWRVFHHELHHAWQRPWDPATVERGLERRLARLRKIGAPRETAAALAERMRAIARRVPAQTVPVSLIHGDCKLRHVWVTDDGVEVLDFGNTKVGDSWADPAAFVTELSMYSLWSNRLVTESHVTHMRTLVDAYFNGTPPPTFWLYVADCMFKKWHRRLRKWGSSPSLRRIRQSLQVVGLDKSVERLYIDRWFTTQIRDWLSLADGKPPEWLRPLAK